MSFISFLIKGTQCPLLQEMQVDKQLSLVTITSGEDHRTLETIKRNDTYLSQSTGLYSIIARSEESLIKIDYSCIDRAKQIWDNFYRKTLYTLVATTVVLAGLVTLSLSRVVKTPLIFVAQLAAAVFFVIAFARADEIYRSKPPFPESFHDYTTGITSAIQKFRSEIIKNGWAFLTHESYRLPSELQDRKTEFFTENEKKLLQTV